MLTEVPAERVIRVSAGSRWLLEPHSHGLMQGGLEGCMRSQWVTSQEGTLSLGNPLRYSSL